MIATPESLPVRFRQPSFLCAYLCVRPLPSRDYTREKRIFRVGSSPIDETRRLLGRFLVGAVNVAVVGNFLVLVRSSDSPVKFQLRTIERSDDFVEMPIADFALFFQITIDQDRDGKVKLAWILRFGSGENRFPPLWFDVRHQRPDSIATLAIRKIVLVFFPWNTDTSHITE